MEQSGRAATIASSRGDKRWTVPSDVSKSSGLRRMSSNASAAISAAESTGRGGSQEPPLGKNRALLFFVLPSPRQKSRLRLSSRLGDRPLLLPRLSRDRNPISSLHRAPLFRTPPFSAPTSVVQEPSNLPLPLFPASPKSACALAEFLSLDPLKPLALDALRKDLLMQNAARELLGDLARLWPEVKEVTLALCAANWREVKQSAGNEGVRGGHSEVDGGTGFDASTLCSSGSTGH